MFKKTVMYVLFACSLFAVESRESIKDNNIKAIDSLVLILQRMLTNPNEPEASKQEMTEYVGELGEAKHCYESIDINNDSQWSKCQKMMKEYENPKSMRKNK